MSFYNYNDLVSTDEALSQPVKQHTYVGSRLEIAIRKTA